MTAPILVEKYEKVSTPAKAGMVHSVSGWTRGVQVKLWDPLRTRAIPDRLRRCVHDEALYKFTFTFTFTFTHTTFEWINISSLEHHFVAKQARCGRDWTRRRTTCLLFNCTASTRMRFKLLNMPLYIRPWVSAPSVRSTNQIDQQMARHIYSSVRRTLTVADPARLPVI